jgi:hypothetical protein
MVRLVDDALRRLILSVALFLLPLSPDRTASLAVIDGARPDGCPLA